MPSMQLSELSLQNNGLFVFNNSAYAIKQYVFNQIIFFTIVVIWDSGIHVNN